jgi:hypothetical protein
MSPLYPTADKANLHAAMLLGRISEVLASNLGRRPAILTEVFVVSQYLQANSEVAHELVKTASFYNLLDSSSL